jgi:hypothetical protein
MAFYNRIKLQHALVLGCTSIPDCIFDNILVPLVTDSEKIHCRLLMPIENMRRRI